ncbi:MAG: cytochrome C [Calditrichaeota bacterium]|nr:MAG: cytochrome C [Calditrichota bacterium]
MSVILTVVALAVGSLVLFCQSEDTQVAYPEGYRDWTHVKSMVLQPGHQLYEAFGGIHHVYANDKALQALKSGGTFPDGAVLVFDLLEALEQDNAIVEGPRKVVGVMEKNSAKFAATGGWGFEGFKGDTRERVVTDPNGQCFACHTSQKEKDFVFSSYRP